MTDDEMYQYGKDQGREDRARGKFSKPIPAEDGDAYARGYLDGWAA